MDRKMKLREHCAVCGFHAAPYPAQKVFLISELAPAETRQCRGKVKKLPSLYPVAWERLKILLAVAR
jgi:hypothetical protein